MLNTWNPWTIQGAYPTNFGSPIFGGVDPRFGFRGGFGPFSLDGVRGCGFDGLTGINSFSGIRNFGGVPQVWDVYGLGTGTFNGVNGFGFNVPFGFGGTTFGNVWPVNTGVNPFTWNTFGYGYPTNVWTNPLIAALTGLNTYGLNTYGLNPYGQNVYGSYGNGYGYGVNPYTTNGFVPGVNPFVTNSGFGGYGINGFGYPTVGGFNPYSWTNVFGETSFTTPYVNGGINSTWTPGTDVRNVTGGYTTNGTLVGALDNRR